MSIEKNQVSFGFFSIIDVADVYFVVHLFQESMELYGLQRLQTTGKISGD